jgi:hypothetical protein
VSVLGRLIARCLTAIAAGLFLASAALALFLLPPITHLFLDIAGSAHYLGVSPRDAHTLSDALVGELLTSGGFLVPFGSGLLLDVGERAHLADVGNLMRLVLLAGSFGAVALLLLAWKRPALVSHAARDGALLISVLAASAGLAFLLAFDATFTFFHGLVFADGTWTFNWSTSHLIQLYPTSFWIPAALSYCAALLIGATVGVVLSRRMARRHGAQVD